MKITPANADRFCSQPDARYRAILVYGPDRGLVRERSAKLGLSVVSDLQDPFLVSELTGIHLKKDPASLADEAMAISMIGGRRILRIEDPGESEAKLFESFLKEPKGDTLIILTAGDLSPGSKLRKLFESAKNAASLACYADDNRSLDRLIHEKIKQTGKHISPDAVEFLVEQLGSDRGVSTQEIDKLLLYCKDQEKIGLEDVLASSGDIGAYSMDMIIYHAAEGNAEGLDQALDKAWAEGIHPVPILRLMSTHLLKIQLVQAKCETGSDVKTAIKSLRPPVFFKMESRFSRQVRYWSRSAISLALPLILQTEADCKKTDLPDKILAGRCLQQIAAIAKREQQR